MMEKTKPMGIPVLATLIILSSLVNIAGALQASDYYWIVMASVFLFFSSFTLMMRNWARLGLLITSLVVLVVAIYTLVTRLMPKHFPTFGIKGVIAMIFGFLVGNALYIVVMFYFTRPKTKQFFK